MVTLSKNFIFSNADETLFYKVTLFPFLFLDYSPIVIVHWINSVEALAYDVSLSAPTFNKMKYTNELNAYSKK